MDKTFLEYLILGMEKSYKAEISKGICTKQSRGVIGMGSMAMGLGKTRKFLEKRWVLEPINFEKIL